MTDEKAARARELLAGGMSCSRVSKEVGVSLMTLRKWRSAVETKEES